ncbi:glycoside hydrolase family 43 protein [Collybiopsis luxurians FD-317 M1]|uniref:Glycoside hydrolase family 43 protein n=1 Tax=Collybiopsis luxurians FD-317 M1 TaxID=944289 RepID=A0A0D0CX66_9AGAR|nr:glycoside hydrolase family 43 protein [Collybiopsis luxurians FD-317 M1]
MFSQVWYRLIFLGLLTSRNVVSAQRQRQWHTDATYINTPSSTAADPYVRWDSNTSLYYAYSTEGADDGWFFGLYTSPDLATWTKLPGGAIKNETASKLWADDWYWAPECYLNENTGWYFLFYAGRMTNQTNVARYFKYPDFEEASKIGVAVSRSPSGPFINIEASPIDYYPFDPDYHDVNLIMSPPYLVPPSTLEEGETAPLGSFIPGIDPDIYFGDDEDEGMFLFFSRNAYRNWVWDPKYNKYIEESNIYGVRLNGAWWNDADAKTLPAVHSDFKDVNKGKLANWTSAVNDSFPAGPERMDGWVSVISRTLQPQIWEDAHVFDYAASNGTLKDRRWSEGSTTIKRTDSDGISIYFLTYSANNYESPDYGVGYAYAPSPLGPYAKSNSNPILSQDASRNIYSTGHGSIVAVPSSSTGSGKEEFYYPHHARPSPDDDRYLYISRLFVDPDQLYVAFGPDTGDLRLPSGSAPFDMQVARTTTTTTNGSDSNYLVTVKNRYGVELDLENAANRVRVLVNGTEVANGTSDISLDGVENGSQVTFRYQRARFNASEPWLDVKQFQGLAGETWVEVNITHEGS